MSCSFAVDDFKKARPDTAIADSHKSDGTLDSESSTDTARDTVAPDSVIVTPDGDALTDARPEVDAGPPTEFPNCTTVGPPETRCIPKTTFTLGATNVTACAPSGCSHEQPETIVTVSQFHVDEHEVTVKRFRAWWNSSPRFWPSTGTTFFSAGAKDLKWRNTWPTVPQEPPLSGCTWLGATNAANDNKPINCVDWFTALAFCMSEGKRLPTEAEWELAAGGDDRLFPWSDPATEALSFTESDVDCSRALKGAGCSPLGTAPTSTAWGRSKFGVWNMAGSFAEWVLDAYVSSYSGLTAMTTDPISDPTTLTTTLRMTRGGSYLNASAALRTAARTAMGTSSTAPDSQIGFRCAKRL